MRHQQPARAALGHLMPRVARGGLHQLREDHLRIAPDQRVQGTTYRDFASKIFDAHPLGIPISHLHQRVAVAIAPALRNASIPSMPSLPTVAASTIVSSDSKVTIDAAPPFKK